ncbi:MAG TPA: hypothetical protein VFR65_04600 [Nitrososphaeraceae archaeon]|nr:hypothetical protein [Nitrososphaeraceae archaeon]
MRRETDRIVSEQFKNAETQILQLLIKEYDIPEGRKVRSCPNSIWLLFHDNSPDGKPKIQYLIM